MLNSFSINSDFCVTAPSGVNPLPRELDALVETLWQAEQAKRGRPLFNGAIFSAISCNSSGIVGQLSEYRRFIAQKNQPDLFSSLQIKPVAISGLLACHDGIILGARSLEMTQDAGLWELVPSGGIDSNYLKAPVNIDFSTQLLKELQEEIGLPNTDCLQIKIIPLCVIEDPITHVIDIGVLLKTTLYFDDIYRHYIKLATNEYTELRIFSANELEKFMTNGEVVEVSKVLFQHYLESTYNLDNQFEQVFLG